MENNQPCWPPLFPLVQRLFTEYLLRATIRVVTSRTRRLGGHKGAHQEGIWGRSCSSTGKSRATALGQEGAQ